MCTTDDDWERVRRVRELESEIRNRLRQRAHLRAEWREWKRTERGRRRVLEHINKGTVDEDATRAAAAEALQAAQNASKAWETALTAIESEINELRRQQAELIVEPYGFRP